MIEVEPGVLVDDSGLSGKSVYLRGHSPPATKRRAKTQVLPPSGPLDIPGQRQGQAGGVGEMEFVKSAVVVGGGQAGSLLTSGLEAMEREGGGGAEGEVAEEEEGTLLGGLE